MYSAHHFRIGACIAAIIAPFQLAASGTDEVPKPPGELVDLGGYRMHLLRLGQGGPAVVFFAGMGDFASDWALVQPEAARGTVAVSYDRGGTGWSEPGPQPYTLHQEAHDVHLALEKAGVKPPYVLVGHSLGALVARVFVKMYAPEVKGVVLVDGTHENGVMFLNGKATRLRETAKARRVPEPSAGQAGTRAKTNELKTESGIQPVTRLQAPYGNLPPNAQKIRLWFLNHPNSAASGDNYLAEEMRDLYTARQAVAEELGAVPLISLGGTKERSAQRLEEMKDLARLSSNGRFLPVPKSGHHIPLEAPEAVVAAIRDVTH